MRICSETWLSWANLALSLLALLLAVLALAPPHRQRQMRWWVAEWSIKLWGWAGRVLGIVHDEMWSRGNGS